MSYTAKADDENPGWYHIPGYKDYRANRKGHILNVKTKHVSEGGDAGRYLKVSVYPTDSTTAKLVYVHELVCRAFHGPGRKGEVVSHENDKRWDNRPSNLKWTTQSKNIEDTYKRGLRKPTTSKEAYQEDHNNPVWGNW